MNCEEYINKFLSAHADGELTPEEERTVVRHLGSGVDDGCAACRARLAEERLLKALIKRQVAAVHAPQDLRVQIDRALDRIDRGAISGRIGIAAVAELRRPRTWIPLAAAAMLLVVVAAGGGLSWIHGGGPSGGVSALSAGDALYQAVYSYETFETAFRPNVP